MILGNRKSLSKKTRFEVFKRDSFKCQYCGQSSPDIILEVDHIKPVVEGGSNELINLLTSCKDCNRGKGKNELSDDSVIKKQQEQLEELNEKRNQLQMMMDWKNELNDLEEETIDMIADYWNKSLNGEFSINDNGRKNVKKWLKKYDLQTLLNCVDKSIEKYLKYDQDGEIVKESVEKTFSYIPRIAYYTVNGQEEYMKDLFYIRGIMRNNFNYVNEKRAIIMLKNLYNAGVDTEVLQDEVLNCRNWTEFKQYHESIAGDA